ncbi:MAG TPA: sigma-70 family RNA polymerase sigma factor [Planctomycetota bacterium]|nr:sigma-70 family RNA polymerase sigma factor [Planctomycetota bacterium]
MRDDEKALVARLRAGDEAAYREVVDAYRDRLLTVISRVAGAGADAEDLAQDAFLKAFGAIGRFDGRSALFTWLYRIAINTARDWHDHRRRRPTVPLEGVDGPLVDPVAPGVGPEQAAVAREERAAVRRALARLPEPFRSTLVLREMEGLSYEDIAEALDVSIGTVESRIFRARCKLRVLLEEELP